MVKYSAQVEVSWGKIIHTACQDDGSSVILQISKSTVFCDWITHVTCLAISLHLYFYLALLYSLLLSSEVVRIVVIDVKMEKLKKACVID